jgi:LytS/YehU family sensor histidine kinase
MVGDLAAFVRESLASEIEEDVDLGREIDLQRRYLALEQRRFGDRLRVIIDADPAVRSARVPTLVLQPLIENVITHAVSRSASPVTLQLRTEQTAGGGVRLTVSDDALPDAARVPGSIGPRGLGLGLRNIAERLMLRYGPHATLEAGPRPDGGWTAMIALPPENERRA